MFHGTYPREYDGIPEGFHFGLRASKLETFFEWINKEKIRLLSLDEYLEGECGVLVTFDDGYANNVEYGMPILERYECPAVFFVTTGHLIGIGQRNWLQLFEDQLVAHQMKIGKEVGYELFYGMSEEHVRTLAEHPLTEVGAHTHRHVRLSQLDGTEAWEDIDLCNQHLERLIGAKPRVFSYPYGDYNLNTVDLVKSAGYEAAFAVKPKGLSDTAFEHPRIGLYYTDSTYLSAKLNFATKS